MRSKPHSRSRTGKLRGVVIKTVVEGRAVIRKEAVMPNILPREKAGNSSDYIWIRMDADSATKSSIN